MITAVQALPILFCETSVLAILEERKTQSRRVIDWKPLEKGLNLAATSLEIGHYFTGHPQHGWVLRSRDGQGVWHDRTHPLKCPYGEPGDRLWVQEAFCHFGAGAAHIGYRATDDVCEDARHGVWQHGKRMRREDSRLLLEISEVRAERLQAISPEDAQQEGCAGRYGKDADGIKEELMSPEEEFSQFWESLNGNLEGHSWMDNPWVFVLTFKIIERKR